MKSIHKTSNNQQNSSAQTKRNSTTKKSTTTWFPLIKILCVRTYHLVNLFEPLLMKCICDPTPPSPSMLCYARAERQKTAASRMHWNSLEFHDTATKKNRETFSHQSGENRPKRRNKERFMIGEKFFNYPDLWMESEMTLKINVIVSREP